jgi:hypothetical protein
MPDVIGEYHLGTKPDDYVDAHTEDERPSRYQNHHRYEAPISAEPSLLL